MKIGSVSMGQLWWRGRSFAVKSNTQFWVWGGSWDMHSIDRDRNIQLNFAKVMGFLTQRTLRRRKVRKELAGGVELV
jgi:hypothetical protein